MTVVPRSRNEIVLMLISTVRYSPGRNQRQVDDSKVMSAFAGDIHGTDPDRQCLLPFHRLVFTEDRLQIVEVDLFGLEGQERQVEFGEAPYL